MKVIKKKEGVEGISQREEKHRESGIKEMQLNPEIQNKNIVKATSAGTHLWTLETPESGGLYSLKK